MTDANENENCPGESVKHVAQLQHDVDDLHGRCSICHEYPDGETDECPGKPVKWKVKYDGQIGINFKSTKDLLAWAGTFTDKENRIVSKDDGKTWKSYDAIYSVMVATGQPFHVVADTYTFTKGTFDLVAVPLDSPWLLKISDEETWPFSDHYKMLEWVDLAMTLYDSSQHTLWLMSDWLVSNTQGKTWKLFESFREQLRYWHTPTDAFNKAMAQKEFDENWKERDQFEEEPEETKPTETEPIGWTAPKEWKLKALGLTYNFHDFDSLMTWYHSRSLYSLPVLIAYTDETDPKNFPWKDMASFRIRLQEVSPTKAIEQAFSVDNPVGIFTEKVPAPPVEQQFKGLGSTGHAATEFEISRLQTKVQELMHDVKHWKDACLKSSREVDQILGRALGYVLTDKDQPELIGCKAGDVFTGVNTVENLADEVADRLRWRDSTQELPAPGVEVVIDASPFFHVGQLKSDKRYPTPCWESSTTGLPFLCEGTYWLPLAKRRS